ncbi:hypothetical protein BJX70DRAFT_131142 [Aspergillus crustosus]
MTRLFYDQITQYFWPVYMYLSSFIEGQRQQQSGRSEYRIRLPVLKSGCGEYSPTSNRLDKSARERFIEDQHVLSEAFRRYYKYDPMSLPQVEDQLTKDLWVVSVTQEMSLSLLFELQVFLDCHYILRDQVSRGFSDLQDFAGRVQSTIELTASFHTDFEVWGFANHDILKTFTSQMAWLQRESNSSALDWLIPSRKRQKTWLKDDLHGCTLGEVISDMKKGSRQFLKWHPLLCGTWLSSIMVEFQELGVNFVSAFNSIFYACHLYNALLQERLLDNRWSDIELLFIFMGMESSLAGGPPRRRTLVSYLA